MIKSQKHIRTGNTEDPVITEIPETNDFETIKSSGYRGDKSLRGDRLTQDNYLFTENLYNINT